VPEQQPKLTTIYKYTTTYKASISTHVVVMERLINHLHVRPSCFDDYGDVFLTLSCGSSAGTAAGAASAGTCAAWPPSPAARAAGVVVVVRLQDVWAGVPDVPGAGRPQDQPPQAAGDDQEEGAVVKGGAGPRVLGVWAGLLHRPGTWRTHEEAPW